MASTRLKALVTGGSGFVGHHLVQQLVDTGRYDVVVFDVRDNGKSSVPVVTGDLRNLDSVVEATKGVDVVFHVATAAPTGQNSLNNQLMQSVNVDGTSNVIKACAVNGVKKLVSVASMQCNLGFACLHGAICHSQLPSLQVYTSSSSVVFEGKDLNNVDESHPYAQKPMDFYVHTKVRWGSTAHAAWWFVFVTRLRQLQQTCQRHPHHRSTNFCRALHAAFWVLYASVQHSCMCSPMLSMCAVCNRSLVSAWCWRPMGRMVWLQLHCVPAAFLERVIWCLCPLW